MYTVPERLHAAMEARCAALPIQARHLVVAAEIPFEESPLPEGVRAVLAYDEGAFRLTVSSTVGDKTQNQIYAKALAHLLLHSDRFHDGEAWVDGDAAHSVLYAPVAIGEAEDNAATLLAIEILVPTKVLRQQFLYHQGNLAKIAQGFQVPTEVVRAACVRRGMLDPRAKVA